MTATSKSSQTETDERVLIKEHYGHCLMLASSMIKQKEKVVSDWFEIDYWQKKKQVSGQSKGRQITWFVNSPVDNDSEWVLRHYYRGGLIAKFNNDHFLYTGLHKSRCYRELAILDELFSLNLPVPRPIAARLIKKGILYSADLLMEKLDAVDLVALLKKQSLDDKSWQKIGALIATFHQQGVYHADLNAHNILMDKKGEFYLIDFDRCERRSIDTIWHQQNLSRLLRSFEKEKKLYPELNFESQHWLLLMKGYKSKGME